MRLVVQRVSRASVTISGVLKSTIGEGLLILIGIEDADSIEDISWLVNKVVHLRIFNDADGVMNLSLKEIQGEIMAISQFTLFASTKKGNRPSYLRASKGEAAILLYEKFVEALSIALEKPVATGQFGADMKVELLNDGPVTILMDSKNRE